MRKIEPESLLTLEAYDKIRPKFRAEVIAHKKNRTVRLGEHVTLLFEDELTMRYQVQEMLLAEKIFKDEGILEELEVYNPLIPDGSNWKATLLIEYEDVGERKDALARLIGIEDRTWVRVEGHSPVHAIADEDLDRETDEKTSAVHFLRFDLSPAMGEALRQGARLAMGIDHENYRVELDPVSEETREALLQDLA